MLIPIFTEWYLTHIKEVDKDWKIKWYGRVNAFVDEKDEELLALLRQWKNIQKSDWKQLEIDYKA